MSGALAAVVGRAFAGVVTLSGETVSGLATALLNVNSNGTATKQQDAATTQIDAATDWIIPNGASAQSGFTVRFTVDSGDTPTTGTVDTDLALSSNRTIGFSSDAGKSCSLTVAIKFNGTVVASNTYPMATT